MGPSSWHRSLAPLLLLVTITLLFGQAKPYPKPQVASAAGEAAPDFTLKDQDGKEFTLSHENARWVLLYFYRGYW